MGFICDYKKNSNQPCEKCPRLITMLYVCGLLQEEAKQQPKPPNTMTAKNLVLELYPNAQSIEILLQDAPNWKHGWNVWIGETIISSGRTEIDAWKNAAVRITKYYR